MNITKDVVYVGVNDHAVDLFEGQYVCLLYTSRRFLGRFRAVRFLRYFFRGRFFHRRLYTGFFTGFRRFLSRFRAVRFVRYFFRGRFLRRRLYTCLLYTSRCV